MEVAVRELKNRLSQYLKRVQDGERIVVTSRGRPVAHLVPVGAPPAADEVQSRLAALPWVDRAEGGKPHGASRPLDVGAGQRALSDIVLDDRR